MSKKFKEIFKCNSFYNGYHYRVTSDDELCHIQQMGPEGFVWRTKVEITLKKWDDFLKNKDLKESDNPFILKSFMLDCIAESRNKL